MEELVELEFMITEDHSVSFTDDELKKIGVVFINEIDELPAAASYLADERVKDSKELKDFGLKMASVGEMSTVWAIHKNELSLNYVKDLWNKNNFYTIEALAEGSKIKEIRRAYLREEFFEEDLAHYIDSYFLKGSLHEMNVERMPH